MWILPKQLHTSHFVPDTAALISDLAEQSQICEQSLLARSKPSLARTWLQKWKRDSWTQHLSGRILKPSHGQSFVTAWTSSLEVIPASHSVQQANGSEKTTQDTSGLGSQMEFALCDHESVSSRTSKDTSASDSEKSLANWKALVIKRRGEYSLRVKSAHLTNASGCLSLLYPTPSARDVKGCNSLNSTLEKLKARKRGHMGQLPNYIMVMNYTHPAQVNPSTDGSRQESWGTPEARSHKGALGRSYKGQGRDLPMQTEGKCENGKLNPRWVETLMGLPVGWTMPSCVHPVTIEPMNCDCSETESSQPQQNELSELF